MPLRANDTPLPHHVLIRSLGSGAMGEVWLVRGPGGVHKAAKFIRLEARHGIKELLAIQRIKQIHHAHLVQITDVWLLDQEGEVIPDEVLDSFSAQMTAPVGRGTIATTMAPDLPRPDMLVVAMSLADESLFDRLEKYRAEGVVGIPFEKLIRYMEEAAKGIDFLNQPHDELGGKAIQHCDIKPQNMLLVGDSIQLCDFGLVRLVGERKTNNQMEGTLAYIAPEAARGQQPTPTTDQYSLAISYYELRTGRLPFDESAAVYDILQAHTSGKLDFAKVDPAEQAVLRKATSLDPAKRYPNNRAFVAALAASKSPPVSKSRIGPLVAAGFLSLAALAVAAATLLPWARTPPRPVVKLPAGFTALAGAPLRAIGDLDYPERIVRSFPDGDEVVLLLIHEPREEQLFYIMENKCWNGLFRKYVATDPGKFAKSEWQRGGQRDGQDLGADQPQLPTLRVTVDEAYGFALWLAGKEHGHLPSVPQWDTAAGLFRPNRTNAGPFLEPYAPDEIAIGREAEGPAPVGTAAKDLSPFQVRDLAGNGTEFTRSLWGSREEVPLKAPSEIDGVILRGRSYASTDGPLRYADLEDSEQDVPWPYPAAQPFTGFRVVVHRLGKTEADK